ncbi:MAG: signal peptidase I [Firmicutes bacterium]|uniref:Signal peptidase I n=1 Tax=Candidatus Scybalomonas excrementavium TaxID=2840943 RepID=A0A9D9I1N5_9FIRM|nr:signal peptidase I [Candidatus Scybalomonas excrementavium]
MKEQENKNTTEEKSISWKKELLSWVTMIAIALGVGLFISKGLIVNAEIPSESMENTIMTGDRLIALRTAYWFSDPERGDIVVFHYPDDETDLYIKRVIGTPGDTVEGKDGKVYVNGEELEEPYIKEEIEEDFGPYTVPEDSYFMMGDNRNESWDSRFWENTYVKKEKILGKAFVRYYPGIKLFD